MANPLLDLDSAPRVRLGRPKTKPPLRAEVVRPLSEADIALAETQRVPRPLKLLRLRDSHHRLAQTLALGVTRIEAGARTGYSLGRIQQLLDDKSFCDLIAVYRKDLIDRAHDFADMATANMIRGERIIGDALEAAADSPEPLALSELRPVVDIVSDRADRFGYSKQNTQVNVNVDFAGKLESARRRAGLIDIIPASAASDPRPKSPLPSPLPPFNSEGEASGGSSSPSAEPAA